MAGIRVVTSLLLAACVACSSNGGAGGIGGSNGAPSNAGTLAGTATTGGTGGAGGSEAGSFGGGSGGSGGSGGGTGGTGDAPTQDAGGMPSVDAGAATVGASLRFYNVYTDEADPRFASLPASISTVELLPRVTLEAVAPAGANSASFEAGALARLDTARPFRLTEDAAGAATAWDPGEGGHEIKATFYASADGSGVALGAVSASLQVTSAGTDDTPGSGEHSQHKLWIDANGYNAAGGDFAFMVLLPEGYDPAVRYPLLVFLHHGDAAYRGTDNNGRPLTTSPLFTGPRAIHKSSTRIDYPAVVLVPQLIAQETIDSVTHEWAAFRSLSNQTGDYEAAAEPSRSARYTFDVVDDMVAGTLMVDGRAVHVDGGRVYVAGHSMGGFGSWDFMMRRPTFWAAGVPMAGYQDHDSAALLKDMPIWAFHHEIDSYNPFHSDTMKALIEGAGGMKMRLSKLTFDTGGQGDQAHFRTPAAAWNDEPELFEWIFSQARARP